MKINLVAAKTTVAPLAMKAQTSMWTLVGVKKVASFNRGCVYHLQWRMMKC